MEFFVKPGEDEQWHQYWIDDAHPLVRRPRHQPREPAPLRAPEGEAVALLEAHRRHRVPLRLRRLGVGRARGHRQPHRLRPDDALAALRHRPRLLRPDDRRALHAVRHRAGGRPVALADDVPRRRLRRGRGAQHQGRRRQARRAAARPAARAGQGRGAAAVAQRRPLAEGQRPRGRSCGSTGTSTSTTPAPSAALPPPGRDRHAVLRHRRLRHPRGPGRDDPRARHDGARSASPWTRSRATSRSASLGC